MNKLIITLLASMLLSGTISAQELKSKNQFKVDLGWDGLGISYDLNINKYLSTEFAVGYGGVTECTRDSFGYTLGYAHNTIYLAPYISANLKYFYKDTRSFVIFKSKFNFNRKEINPVWTNELGWGQRYNLGKGFLFQYNVGGGYYYNPSDNLGKIRPSIGITFSYVIF